MHPAVAALPMEERGFVLGALLARRSAAWAGQVGGDRCRDALTALAEQPRAVRASTVADLIGQARAPLPAGLERVHPGWLRERLALETADVIRAVTEGLPVEVRRVAAEILAEQGERPGPAPAWSAAGLVALRRVVFAGLLPLADPGAPAGPEARALLDVSFAAVEEAIELRGAATLGTSIRGAPPAVVAQAAAGLGGRLARALLEAAGPRGEGGQRDRARLLVSATASEIWAPLAMRLGLRALAVALSAEGGDAVAAIAQRLPPVLGRRLVALAADPWG